MNQSEIVEWISKWLAERDYEVDGEIGPQKVNDVIDTSLDVVELTMDLEDVVGVGEDELDLEELAPKFASLTFNQLADEIVKLLENK